MKKSALNDMVSELLNKECIRELRPGEKGFFSESFPRAEEVGRLPTGHRPVHAELLTGKKDIFHGHVSQSKASSSGRNVGNVDRPCRTPTIIFGMK